jgi:hypothetical protein
VYEAIDESGARDGSLALFRYFSLPLIATVAGSVILGPTAGAVGLAVGLAYGVWAWRGRKKRGGAVLRVEREVLHVVVRGAKGRNERVRLGDLANVTLDVKTIERVMEGNSAIPDLRFIDAKVGPKVDTAKVVLETAAGRQIPRSDEHLPHMHATEWLGKIRVFLRKHGWLPEDEREAAPSSRGESDAG